VIGRCANRIACGRAEINGRAIRLPINNPPHHLHGGPDGFDRRHFHVEPLSDGLRLLLVSPDNDQGYPGRLDVCVEYRLGADNTIGIEMSARSDAPTMVNLTQHTYFNLAGASTPPIPSCLRHTLRIAADAYLPVRPDLIPIGETADVAGTPFDFRLLRPLQQGMDSKNAQLSIAKGYDHCFVLAGGKTIGTAAELSDPDSGRRLAIATDQPGIQIYTGNYLGGIRGKNGAVYDDHSGVALECQNWPDAVNQSRFPTPIVVPGEEYRHQTRWKVD
jgi:aldose 1-epimerase